MKKLIFVLCMLSILLGGDYYAQRRTRARGADDDNGPKKRIEELEKLKLIDVLNLDDKTMIQFFARRKEFNENLQKLEEEKNVKLDEIHEMLEDGAKDQDYKKVINDIIDIDNRISKTREDYLTSLDGLLTNEQRAKLLLFDRNFRKEIREIIFKHRVEKN